MTLINIFECLVSPLMTMIRFRRMTMLLLIMSGLYRSESAQQSGRETNTEKREAIDRITLGVDLF